MKNVAWGAVLLLGAALISGSSQSVVKNKKLRDVPIKLQKDLIIGERPGEKEPLFQSIRNFRVDGRGNIFVLDGRAPKLIKFSPDGSILFSIGRKGQGPGEFMIPTTMELGKQNSILVYDIGNRRCEYFSADTGALLEEKSTARLSRLFRVDDDSQGFFFGTLNLPGPEQTVQIVSKYSPSLESIKEFFRIEDEPRGNKVRPFAPNLLFRVLSDDLLLVANDAEYKFYWYDAKGGLLRTVQTDYRPVAFTAADKERYIKAYTADGGPLPNDEIFVFPDKYPPIEHLITDDRDNIFVRTHEVDKENRHYYEAFDRSGKPVGRFALGFAITCVVGDRMYSREQDENGLERICRYRFQIAKK